MAKTASSFPGVNEPAPDFNAETQHSDRSLSIDSLCSHQARTQNNQEKFGVTIPFPTIDDSKMEVTGVYGMVPRARPTRRPCAPPSSLTRMACCARWSITR